MGITDVPAVVQPAPCGHARSTSVAARAEPAVERAPHSPTITCSEVVGHDSCFPFRQSERRVQRLPLRIACFQHPHIQEQLCSRLPRQPGGPVRLTAAQPGRDGRGGHASSPNALCPQVTRAANMHTDHIHAHCCAGMNGHAAGLATTPAGQQIPPAHLYVTSIDSPCAAANSSTAPLTAPSCLLPSMQTAARRGGGRAHVRRSCGAAAWQKPLLCAAVPGVGRSQHKGAQSVAAATEG